MSLPNLTRPGLSLPALRTSRPGLAPPAGFAFLIAADGAFLVDADGAFLIVEIAPW